MATQHRSRDSPEIVIHRFEKEFKVGFVQDPFEVGQGDALRGHVDSDQVGGVLVLHVVNDPGLRFLHPSVRSCGSGGRTLVRPAASRLVPDTGPDVRFGPAAAAAGLRCAQYPPEVRPLSKHDVVASLPPTPFRIRGAAGCPRTVAAACRPLNSPRKVISVYSTRSLSARGLVLTSLVPLIPQYNIIIVSRFTCVYSGIGFLLIVTQFVTAEVF